MSIQVSCDGMRDPSKATNLDTRKTAEVEGRTLELLSGDLGDDQYAWARLTNAHDGDSFWLEISGDGGQTWIKCGRRTIHAGDQRNYTQAQITNRSDLVRMRAGLQLGTQHHTAKW